MVLSSLIPYLLVLNRWWPHIRSRVFDINVSVLKSIPSIYLLVTKGPRPVNRVDMPEQRCAPSPLSKNARSTPPNLTQWLDLQCKVSHVFSSVEYTWLCSCRLLPLVPKVLEAQEYSKNVYYGRSFQIYWCYPLVKLGQCYSILEALWPQNAKDSDCFLLHKFAFIVLG